MLLADRFESWRERVSNSSSALRTSICDEISSLTDVGSGQLGPSPERPLSVILPTDSEGVLTNLHQGRLFYTLKINQKYPLLELIIYADPIADRYTCHMESGNPGCSARLVRAFDTF